MKVCGTKTSVASTKKLIPITNNGIDKQNALFVFDAVHVRTECCKGFANIIVCFGRASSLIYQITFPSRFDFCFSLPNYHHFPLYGIITELGSQTFTRYLFAFPAQTRKILSIYIDQNVLFTECFYKNAHLSYFPSQKQTRFRIIEEL